MQKIEVVIEVPKGKHCNEKEIISGTKIIMPCCYFQEINKFIKIGVYQTIPFCDLFRKEIKDTLKCPECLNAKVVK